MLFSEHPAFHVDTNRRKNFHVIRTLRIYSLDDFHV